jgi:hypothetical protein
MKSLLSLVVLLALVGVGLAAADHGAPTGATTAVNTPKAAGPLALSANGRAGTITVIREAAPDKFSVVQTLPTVKGARMVTVDPQTHRFYLPCQLSGEGDKKIFGLVVVGATAQNNRKDH